MPGITITPTEKVVTMDGARVRVWEGMTEHGQMCKVYTMAVIPDDMADMKDIKESFGLQEVKRRVTNSTKGVR